MRRAESKRFILTIMLDRTRYVNRKRQTPCLYALHAIMHSMADTPTPPGEILKAKLRQRGWTYEDLAYITGRSLKSIGDLARGVSGVTPDFAAALAAAFDLQSDWCSLTIPHVELIGGMRECARIFGKNAYYSRFRLRVSLSHLPKSYTLIERVRSRNGQCNVSADDR